MLHLVCIVAFYAKIALSLAIPAPARLRLLLEKGGDGEMPILLPCCYDGLTARLVARAGFEATFMTGFGVSGKTLSVLELFFNECI